MLLKANERLHVRDEEQKHALSNNNKISFIGKTKKVRAQADTAATGTITQYIGIWKIRKLN